MSRSKWKMQYFSNFILRKIIILKKKNDFKRKKFIFYNRSSSIPNCFNNYYFRVHKGNIFRRIMINIFNVGYKFGEFSFTRKPFHYPLKKINKKKNLFLRK